MTGWSPHWIFARFDLRYLEDPRGVQVAGSRCTRSLAQTIDRDFPSRLTAFLARLYVPIEKFQRALLVANEKTVKTAVDDFLQHESTSWTTG